MVSILQGSNTPLVLEIEGISRAVKISAVLTSYGKTLKEWETDDVTIQDDNIILQLTEADTLSFSRGFATLDLKILDSAGIVVFMDLVEYKIVERNNKHVFTGG